VKQPATKQARELKAGKLRKLPETSEGELKDWRLGRLLGRGSFGLVFAARERKTGYPGAIKVMDRSRIKATSINREHTVLEALGDHPGVVRYLGTYKTWATVSFAMERVTGGELFEYLIHTGAMTEEQARASFVPVLRALAYLHGGAGSGDAIVHRDLKPENLLLVPVDRSRRQVHRFREKLKAAAR